MLEHNKLIIKDRAIVEDSWSVLRLPPVDAAATEGPGSDQDPATIEIPEGKVIVPLAVWQAQRAAIEQRAAFGVWIASDERPEVLKGEVDKFAVIAVDFPKFTDGRGYSIAYNLRARLGYTGELRAIGDVLRDQLFSMARVGFDAFATRQDRSIDDALKGLTDFSETYQASWDNKLPLFRRHERHTRIEGGDVGFGI
jgi:uncharacterized protein (DUF934 family)